MNDLTNKVAMVTGVASGIGECVVERFLGDECIVAMLDRDRNQLQRAVEKFKTASSANRLHSFEVDVCNGCELRRITEEVASFKGGIDIVVNSAGIVRVGPFCEISESEWKEVLDINLNGVFNTCQAAIPALRRGRSGNIVNVASWFGKVGRPYYAANCASKFAVIGLMQVLALELASENIRVNAVCPGTVADTAMREYADDRSRELGLPEAKERTAQIPLGRLARPQDISDTVAFLVSNKSNYITGQAINVTGGLWML
jgi:meso-butanediol dehydrogenase / (S,S)-butanediol dehydrogenase / diacetyl reductase